VDLAGQTQVRPDCVDLGLKPSDLRTQSSLSHQLARHYSGD
jgi:hypothetical protein